MKNFNSNKIFFKLIIIVLAGMFSNFNVPKNPHNSWSTIIEKGMKIGVVLTSEQSQKKQLIQKERQMMEDFSSQNRVSISYVTGSETVLIESLKAYDLHVVIGGYKKIPFLKKKSP